MTASPAFAEGDRVRVRRGSRLLECTVEGIPAGDGLVTVRRADNGRRFLAVMTEILPLTRSAHAFNVQERVELDPDHDAPMFDPPPPPCVTCRWEGAHAPKCPNASRAVPKSKPKRSRSYLAWVRDRGACQNCGHTQNLEAAHFGPAGTATKADDRRVNVLCGSDPASGREGCHACWHRTGRLPNRRDGYELTLLSRLESESLLYRWQTDLLIEFLDLQEGRHG